MTDPPPAGRSPGLFKHLDKITENRWLKALVAIGEVVGLFVLVGSGVSWLVRTVGDDDTTAGSITSPSVVVPSGDGSTRIPSVPSSSAPRSTDPAYEQLCFSSTSTAVDCRENHRFEMLPTFGACDQRMVIDYVGGRAALDVTIAKSLEQPGPGRCWLDAGRDVTGTAKNVLEGRDSANWRRCYDRRTGKNVSCGVLHSGEYLATGSLRPATDAECQVAAATYLDQNPGNLLEDLEVRPLPVESGNPDTARCIINARGNHLLTTSVRDLGSRPVPIYSQ